MNYEEIRAQSAQAVRELLAAAKLRPGSILVVGCSSSEIVGSQIGHGSSLEAAQAVYEGIAPVLREAGVFLAACKSNSLAAKAHLMPKKFWPVVREFA